LAFTRWLASLLFETSPLDPLTFIMMPLLLLALVLLSSALPAERPHASILSRPCSSPNEADGYDLKLWSIGMIPYFQRLGERIERAWLCRSYNEDIFPQLALDELERDPPLGQVATKDLIDWTLGPVHELQQPRDNELFGKPPVMLYQAPRFYIEALLVTGTSRPNAPSTPGCSAAVSKSHLPQLSYQLPGLAVDNFDQAPLRKRRLTFLHNMAQGQIDGLAEYARRMVENGDLVAVYYTFSMLTQDTVDKELLDELYDIARQRHGETVDLRAAGSQLWSRRRAHCAGPHHHRRCAAPRRHTARSVDGGS
jgi:hypothetical protein